MKEYLQEMTDLAIKYDMIIADSFTLANYNHDLKYGPKLYWDTDNQCYAFVKSDRTVVYPTFYYSRDPS